MSMEDQLSFATRVSSPTEQDCVHEHREQPPHAETKQGLTNELLWSWSSARAQLPPAARHGWQEGSSCSSRAGGSLRGLLFRAVVGATGGLGASSCLKGGSDPLSALLAARLAPFCCMALKVSLPCAVRPGLDRHSMEEVREEPLVALLPLAPARMDLGGPVLLRGSLWGAETVSERPCLVPLGRYWLRRRLGMRQEQWRRSNGC